MCSNVNGETLRSGEKTKMPGQALENGLLLCERQKKDKKGYSSYQVYQSHVRKLKVFALMTFFSYEIEGKIIA